MEEGSEGEEELVPDEAEEGVLALLEQVVLVLETPNVVVMQIVDHVLPRVRAPLQLLPLLPLPLPQVDAHQREVHLVPSLRQYTGDLVQLVRKNYPIHPLEVHHYLAFRWRTEQSVLRTQLIEILAIAFLLSEDMVDSFNEVFPVAMVAFFVVAPIKDDFDSPKEGV